MKKLLLASLAAVLAAVVGTQVYSQTQTTPPPGGVIAIACTYQSNEANAAILTGRYGLAQCDNRGYLKVTPSGSGGGGGAVTIADGADVTQGALADAACATDTGVCTVASMLKRIAQSLTTIATNVASSIPAGSAAIGNVGTAPRAAQLSTSPVAFTTAGDNGIIVRVTGTIKVYRLAMACTSTVDVTAKNGSTSLGGAMRLTTLFLPYEGGEPHFTTTGTNNFVLNVSPAGFSCGGTVWYLDN